MGPSNNPVRKRQCSEYSPGHEAFYLKQLSVLNRGQLAACELLEVSGLSVTVCVDGDRVQTFWTHDPELLDQCLERAASPDFKLGYGQGLLFLEGTAPEDGYVAAKCLHVLEQPTDCDIEVSEV